jgi:hypothetical protein
MSITNSIPTPISNLLSKLGVIAQIDRGDKLNLCTMTFTESTSWVGALSRYFSGDNRKDLIDFLRQTIQDATDLVNEFKNTVYAKIIVDKLTMAKIGIQNLANTTYRSDPLTVSELQICITNIDLVLDNNRALINGLNHVPTYYYPQIVENEDLGSY